jgi:hypothetical protein
VREFAEHEILPHICDMVRSMRLDGDFGPP